MGEQEFTEGPPVAEVTACLAVWSLGHSPCLPYSGLCALKVAARVIRFKAFDKPRQSLTHIMQESMVLE